MTTTYSVEYLRGLYQAVEAFSETFEAWMETQNEATHWESRGLLPTVTTKNGMQDEATKRALVVAEAAGRIGKSVQVTGAYYAVQGMGMLDPIANWAAMSSPKAIFTADEIRTTAATIRGRLKALEAEAEAQQDQGMPGFGPADLHELVWGAAAKAWTSHLRRLAVSAAGEALTQHWKSRLGRVDVDATEFWQQTLKNEPPRPGVPRLRWPGDDNDRTAKSIRGGLASLAAGLNLTVRNPAVHRQSEYTEQEALEQLGAYSALARMLDQCEILTDESEH